MKKNAILINAATVLGHPVKNAVQYYKHADGHHLLTQFKNVAAYEPVCRIHISLLREGVKRTS